jgi:DNA repair exonuclease SbcCD nuclease subunit
MKLISKSIAVAFLICCVCLFTSVAQEQAPSSGAAPAKTSLKFAIIGDTGSGDKAQYDVGRRLAEARAKVPFGIVIMMGDNMYGGEEAKDFASKFERPYAPLLSSGVQFFASLGNHDSPGREIAYKPFNMAGRRYYSFEPADGVEFFALDSNYVDRKQLQWFEDELRKSKDPWKIAFFHHPPYSSGKKHGSDLAVRTALEPLFIKYNVSVVFSGHEHFYERIKPQKGIQYFILGNSGQLRKDGIESGSPITAKGFDSDYAFMTAEINGDTLSFKTISRMGNVVDSGSTARVERKPGT